MPRLRARTSHPTSIDAKHFASKQSFQSMDSWCFMLKVQWEFLVSAKNSPIKIGIGKKKHQHSPNQPLIRQPAKKKSFFCLPVSSGFPVLYAHWTGEKKTNKSDVYLLGGRFKYFFTPIWGRFPIWLIFFKWVETTNQKMMGFLSIRWKNRKGAEFTLSTLWIGSGQL